MVKGRFNIRGTKDFLVAAVVCGFLCAWAIRDAWFPTEKILKKHPRETAVAFEVPGVVKDIPVHVGSDVLGEAVLAVLYDDSYQEKLDVARAAFEKAKEDGDSDVIEKTQAALIDAREDVAKCTLRNTDITVKTSHGEDSLKGVVLKVLATPSTPVEAGQPVLMIKPSDTFYIFNKTLTILSFFGMIVFLIFHWIASK